MELYGRGYQKYQNAKSNTRFQKLNSVSVLKQNVGEACVELVPLDVAVLTLIGNLFFFFGLTGTVGCLHLVI